MFLVLLKKYFPILLISLLMYLLFFWKLFLPQYIIYSGRDSTTFHYQSRIYLYEQLQKGTFPYWTEKMFLGFPVYADMERGYLNPINVLLVKYLDPFYSYKLLHFSCYLIGSLSLYLFLKKYGVDYWGFASSNAIYFFSFFLLYHQQHFNMVLTTYLFPFGLLLLDFFINSNRLRFALYNALLLAFCFYLGSFQFVFLFILLELIYLISVIGISKKSLLFFGFMFAWFFTLILPGLFSTYGIYIQSDRSNKLEFTQGSFIPSMLSNVAVPFLFNLDRGYMGTLLSEDYLMHETYVYIGVSSLLIAVLSYLLLNNVTTKRFINYLLITFMALAFIGSIPIINSVNLPPLSLFRYWGRSIVFLNLAVSILVGVVVSNKNLLSQLNIKKIFARTNLKLISIPLLYFILLDIFSIFGVTNRSFEFDLNNSSLVMLLKVLARDDYVFGYWYIIWVIVGASLILALLFKKLRTKEFLTLIVIVDILIFGCIATSNSLIEDKSSLNLTSPLTSDYTLLLKDKRVIDLTGVLNGDNNLLVLPNIVSGYSVLYPKIVSDRLKDLGVKSLRHSTLLQSPADTISFYKSLSDLGIAYVIDLSNTPVFIGDVTKDLPRVQDTTDLLRFETDLPDNTVVNTYVRNYYGWDIYLDNVKVFPHSTSEDMFIQIDVPSGKHVVEMKFIPKDLYNGINISIIVLIALSIITYIMVKRQNKWIF